MSNQNILIRNDVKITGSGQQTIIYAPGFGCDQTVWTAMTKAFENDDKAILFDDTGMGNTDVNALAKAGKYMPKYLSNSENADIKATGHCPHRSHPEETSKIIHEYLESVY